MNNRLQSVDPAADAAALIRPERITNRAVASRPPTLEENLPPEPAETGGVNIAVVLHAIRRNWLLGATVGVVTGALLAGITWLAHKNEYKATALLRISPQHTPLLFETADQSGRADFKSYKSTQRQLMLAPSLLNNAIKKAGVAQLPVVMQQADPIPWLQEELHVTFPDNAEIMEVSISLPDPKSSTAIVDAVVSTYYDEVVVADQNERLKRVDNLEKVQADAEIKARSKRSELGNLVETLGSGDASTLNLAQQAIVQQYGLLRSELTKIQFELMRAEGELQFRPKTEEDGSGKTVDGAGEKATTPAAEPTLEKPRIPATGAQPQGPAAKSNENRPVASPDVRLAQLMEADPVGSKYVQQAEQLALLIEQTEGRLDPVAAAPYLEKYREKLAATRKNVEERTQALQDLLSSQAGGIDLRHTGRVDLEREIRILKNQERQLQDELKRHEAESKKFGKSSIDVDMTRSEVEGLDKVAAHVTEELERTKIELKSNSRITVLGPAQAPQLGESKRRLPLTAALGLLGFMGPLALLVGFDLRRKFVNGSSSLNESPLEVLGSLPKVPRSMMRRLGNVQDSRASIWRRRLNEAVSAITALLLRRCTEEGHRVLLITSATPGEGKSTLAEQLGNSLAATGCSTLLIDFDLRRPTLHRRFGLPLEPGVTDVLRSEMTFASTVREAGPSGLKLLTAGTCPGSLLQDSASGELQALFNFARANFEFVLVDSCPILPVMDGRVVGQYTDGAILSAIKDFSLLPNLEAAREMVESYGIPVLGCVVTGDRADPYHASYVHAENAEAMR